MDTVDKEKRFQEIYDQYSNLVWWHLQNKIVGNRDYLEDIFQNIWMGVWKAVDKIEPGKEHAFIYRVIENQLKKFFYYNSRNSKYFRREEIENSEGDEFSVIDTCSELLHQTEDPYTYFEILDAIENILTEEEMEFLIMYLQGFKINEMKKMKKKGYNYFMGIQDSVSRKLEEEFENIPTFVYFEKHKKRDPMTEEQRKKISEIRKGQPSNTKGHHWYNNGVIEKNLKECPEGWEPGRLKKIFN